MPIGEYLGDLGERNPGRCFLLAFTHGSNFIEELQAWAAQRHVVAATVSGIGAFEEAVFGVWDASQKRFLQAKSDSASEIISLAGTIGHIGTERAPYIHIHGAVSRHDFRVIGGHLISAVVADAVELEVRDIGSFPLNRFRESKIDGSCALAIRDALLADH